MQLQMTTLVSLIILLALIAFSLALHGFVSGSADQSAPACATQVQMRSAAIQIDAKRPAEMSACATRNRFFEPEETGVSQQFQQDLAWCMQSFEDADVLTETNTYCHVCALYQQEGGTIQNPAAPYLEENPRNTPAFIEDLPTWDADEDFEIDISEPVAIMYIQDKTVDKSFLGWLFPDMVTGAAAGAGGAGIGSGSAWLLAGGPKGWIAFSIISAGTLAGGVGGAYISTTDQAATAEFEAGIVITPYNKDTMQQAGCTLTTPQ